VKLHYYEDISINSHIMCNN